MLTTTRPSYGDQIELIRKRLFTSPSIETIHELQELVQISPKEFLPYWPLFFSRSAIIDTCISPEHTDAFYMLVKIAVKGSTGILKSRMRHSSSNLKSCRPFTSLSESIASCLRDIWVFCLQEKSLGVMKTISCTNSLSGFLSESEILALLEGFCWEHIEGPNAESAMCIAHCTARSLKSSVADNGLALRYISAAGSKMAEFVWPFFELLDPENLEAWSTALSVLSCKLDTSLVDSYVHIVEIMLSRECVRCALFHAFVKQRIIPICSLAVSEADLQRPLLACINAISTHYDLSPDLNMILSCLSEFTTGHSEAIYQFLGNLAQDQYSFAVPCKDRVVNFLLKSSSLSEKRIWALANMLSNHRFVLDMEKLRHVDRLLMQKVDEPMLASMIRCRGALAQRHEAYHEALFMLVRQHLLTGSAKVQWTCANSLLSLPMPDDIVHSMIDVLERTVYYKVAISVGRCLGSVLQRNKTVDGVERISGAILNQRFTLRDQYSGAHQQTLRKINGDLLQLLDKQ